MKKLLVFQHAPVEILGSLLPVLKRHKFRIRHVNFLRDQSLDLSMERYDGLVILGGLMAVYESETYPHINTELKLIEKALKLNQPILGICLGAQLIAHALGARVYKLPQIEAGWCEVTPTASAPSDPLFRHFHKSQKIFQMHGDGFDLPANSHQLARSAVCEQQAFVYNSKVYGLQFHLEANADLIRRCFGESHIRAQYLLDPTVITEALDPTLLEDSLAMSDRIFSEFAALFGSRDDRELLGSDHGKGSD